MSTTAEKVAGRWIGAKKRRRGTCDKIMLNHTYTLFIPAAKLVTILVI
jgi:hypothetical protein